VRVFVSVFRLLKVFSRGIENVEFWPRFCVLVEDLAEKVCIFALQPLEGGGGGGGGGGEARRGG
jgi:hypothetical protein